MNAANHRWNRMYKAEWRTILHRKRTALTSWRRKAASASACRSLADRTVGFRLVLSYASFGSELDVAALNAQLAKQGALVLPRVEGFDLHLYQVEDPSNQLKPSRWGILEPDPECCLEVNPIQISIAIVPGLGFNLRQNQRIGYGKGFYDRLLPKLSLDAPKYGVGFQEQSCPNIPFDEADFPLSSIYLF